MLGGTLLGNADGTSEGRSEGKEEGPNVGVALGETVGSLDGEAVDGKYESSSVGNAAEGLIVAGGRVDMVKPSAISPV